MYNGVKLLGVAAIALLTVAVLAAADAGKSTATEPSEESLNLVRKCDFSGRDYCEVRVGEKIVYYHQRMIGDVIVERDFIVYWFDATTEEFLGKRAHWRSDLTDELPELTVTKEQAEARAEGEIRFAKLYYIAPRSAVLPIEPTPQNPCWVVESVVGRGLVITVIDAVTGVVLGYGVPPPWEAFSFSGPQYFEPCEGTWDYWYQNAEFWFNAMGYSTEATIFPDHPKIQSHISSQETAVFYEIAHSGELSTRFASGCIDGLYREYTYASDIEAWMEDYPKMPFAFLASCYSMCDTSYGNLSHAFRKGSTEGTATIGYCDMSLDKCWPCWLVSLEWQDTLFSRLSEGWPVKEAFDYANAVFPVCPDSGCILFAGDDNLVLSPKVYREPIICGDADGSRGVDIDDAVYLIAYIFIDGPEPVPDRCSGDADGSGSIRIDDVVYLIAYVFSGGPPPQPNCCFYK